MAKGSRPPHCSKTCPFWERCEAGARITEHSLTACSCLVACTFWSGRLRRAARWPAELRNVINLSFALNYWAYEDKELWKNLSHLFVPLAVLAHWGKYPLAKYVKYIGGACQLTASLLEWRAAEVAHDLLETPVETVMPELCQSAIGIGSGCWLLYESWAED